MVHVLPDVVEVVVLAPGPDALLAVHRALEAGEGARRVRLPQKYRLKLGGFDLIWFDFSRIFPTADGSRCGEEKGRGRRDDIRYICTTENCRLNGRGGVTDR